MLVGVSPFCLGQAARQAPCDLGFGLLALARGADFSGEVIVVKVFEVFCTDAVSGVGDVLLDAALDVARDRHDGDLSGVEVRVRDAGGALWVRRAVPVEPVWVLLEPGRAA